MLLIKPRYALGTRVTYGLRHPQLVAPFEEHDARRAAGYTVEEWYEMSPRGRAMEVALRRLSSQVQLLQNAEVQDHFKKKRGRR